MLAVVIVSYKSHEQTTRFVMTELPKISVPHKVVIVNNAATSIENKSLASGLGAVPCIIGEESNGQDYIYVLENPENSGFAKGCNIGARFAIDVLHSDYLLFTNNDIILLDSDVVHDMERLLECVPQAGIVGPKILGLDGRLQSPEPYLSFAKRHIWMYLCTPFITKKQKRKLFALDYSETAEEGFHYKLMGSFFMVRSCDFIECGMMDEGTFLFAEEPILTERMAAIGLKPYYLPSVSVLHEHGKTISNTFSFIKQDDIQFDSEVYYYRKYKSVGSIQVFIARIVRKFRMLLLNAYHLIFV